MDYTPEEIARERELEEQATRITKSRVAEAVKRTGLAETTGGKMLVKRSLDALAGALADWMQAEEDRRGPKSKAYPYFHILQPDQLAFLTLRALISNLKGRQKYDDTINLLVRRGVIPAAQAVLFEQKDNEKFAKLSKKLNWQPRQFVRERIAREEFAYAGVELEVSDREVVAMGALLIDLACSTTGAFEVAILGSNKSRRVRLEAADLSPVMEAVNHIQETPWRVNQRVANVWRSLLGSGLAGCSSEERVEVPEALDPEDEGFEKRKAERRVAFEAIRENNANRSTEAQKQRMLSAMKGIEEWYFPHNLDFRGRIYPLAGVGAINPQGDDSGKALIEFAKGQPLGEDGLQWLYIHAQNCWGNDKVSLQERIEASEDNFKEYWSYGSDPLTNTGWMGADKPFCFLACCFELRDIAMMEYEGGEAADYESHLPIALDGSCSGLQHFAGIMRDRPLAAAVNVVQDSDEPADIYSQVATRVAQIVSEDDSEEACYWRGKVTRDLVKQPVMTLSYGVTSSGMRSQVQEKCKKLVYKKGKSEYSDGSSGAYPAYLARVIQTAITDVSRAAFDVMDWLGAVAVGLVDGHPDSLEGALGWTSPVGLPVLQEYYDFDMQTVNVFVEGRRIRFERPIGPAAVRKSKQKQGAAPNFIHSMDASHLMMTVNEAALYGIDSFAMIHDSFATHAADTGTLFEVLRDQFARMYQDDVLMELYESLPPHVQEVVGLPPARGTLDLSEVQESEYFFA